MSNVINMDGHISEHNFELGDVVQLRSGSPLMVIDKITPSGKITCIQSAGGMEGKTFSNTHWAHVLETAEDSIRRRISLDQLTPTRSVSSQSIPEPVSW